MTESESFTIIATGQIDKCEIPGVDNAYCKWGVIKGKDWQLVHGTADAVTQRARRGTGPTHDLVWNFPVDLTFAASNAFGWPKMCFEVYGLTTFGADVIQGYGFTHIPCTPGRYNLKVHLFKPRNQTGMTSIQSWLQRSPPEFKDKGKFVCESEGREVTTVKSSGHITLTLNVATKDMAAAGYDDGASVRTQSVLAL